MSKERRDKEYLNDIKDSIERVASYIEGMTYDVFMKDNKTQDAVVRNLEVVGEATKYLSDRLRKKHPQIPWRDLAGVRDKLIHGYFRIDYDIVWNIITNELPLLLPRIEELLVEESNGGL